MMNTIRLNDSENPPIATCSGLSKPPNNQIFEEIENEAIADRIYSIICHAFNKGNINEFLTQTNASGETLKAKIEKKLSIVENGALLRDRINLLISLQDGWKYSEKFLKIKYNPQHYPLLEAYSSDYSQVPAFISVLISWLEDRCTPDLDEQELTFLLREHKEYLDAVRNGGEERAVQNPTIGLTSSSNGSETSPTSSSEPCCSSDLEEFKPIPQTSAFDDNKLIKNELMCGFIELSRSTINFQNRQNELFLSHSYKDLKSTVVYETQCQWVDILLLIAVDRNKPRFVEYLIEIGAKINALTKKSRFSCTYSKMISLVKNEADTFENSKHFSILSSLLRSRQQVTHIELLKILNFCSQNYKLPGSVENHSLLNSHLFDEAVSLLLGFHTSINDFFKNERELYNKYIAHLNEMKDLVSENSSNHQRLSCKDISRFTYERLRLRLLLQIIVENSLADKHVDISQTQILKEFLIGLETSWVNKIIEAWGHQNPPKQNRSKIDDEQLNKFCEILSKYIYRQIELLDNESEYVFHGGWPGHSVSVVFSRHNNELYIRVDSKENHPSEDDLKNMGRNRDWEFLHSKLLAIVDFQNLPKDALESYLTSLIDNVANRNHTQESVPTLIDRVYKLRMSEEITCTSGLCQSPGVEVRMRLGDELARNILASQEEILLHMDEIYRQNSPLPLVFDGVHSTWVNNKMNFDFCLFIRKELKKHYERLIPTQTSRYIMKPSSNGFSSNLCFPLDKNQQFPLLSANPHNSLDSTLYSELMRKLQEKKQCRIRINGLAGIGKTLLSKDLCKRWQSHSDFGTYIFYLSLRNLSNEVHYPRDKEHTLIDIIEREIFIPTLNRPLNPFERRLLENEIQNRPTVWVLDGLDEFRPLPQLKRALSVLRDQQLLVITSRPRIENSIFSVPIDYDLHLDCYAEEEVIRFINAFFNCGFSPDLNAFSKLQDELIQAFKTNPQLKELCSQPIILHETCRMLSEGKRAILTTRNLARVYDLVINSLLCNAFKRQVKGASRTILEDHLTDTVNEKNVLNYYRRAMKFLLFVSFASLKEERCVTCTTDLINNALRLFGISENCDDFDHQMLMSDLQAIGLIQFDIGGAEFIYANFQDYFAGLYIIKCLSKRGRTAKHKAAKEFIAAHRNDPNYQNIFLSIVHRLSYNLSKEMKNEKKKTISDLLHAFLSNFMIFDYRTIDLTSSSSGAETNQSIAQAISLLDVYSRNIVDNEIDQESFIEWSSPYVEGTLKFIIEQLHLQDRRVDLLPDNNLEAALTNVANFFAITPALKDKLPIVEWLKKKIDGYLIAENSTFQTQDQDPLKQSYPWVNCVINSLYFIKLSQSLTEHTINQLVSIGKSLSQRGQLAEKIIELLLDHTESLLVKMNLSERDHRELNAIGIGIDLLFKDLIESRMHKDSPFIPPDQGMINARIASLLPQIYRWDNRSLLYHAAKLMLWSCHGRLHSRGFVENIAPNLDAIEKEIDTLDANSLVVFDIDYTLIVPKDSILRQSADNYFYQWRKGVAFQPEREEILSSLILLQSPSSLVDERILDILGTLKNKKIKTIALTAMSTGVVGLIPNMEAWRLKQLGDLGIQLDWSFPSTEGFTLDEFGELKCKPVFKEGILISTSYPKGRVLSAFLKKLDWKPSKIIFVDDRLDFIASVEAEIEKEGIPLVSFHYTAALDRHCHLDERVADFQLNHWIEKHEWINDERANQLLSSNS